MTDDVSKIGDEMAEELGAADVPIVPDKSNTQLKREAIKAKRNQTLDKKKTEQWMAGPELSDTQKQLVKRTIAKDLTGDEFVIFLYRCRAYWLDPLKGEISVQIRNKDNPEKRQMVVIVQRDGYLTIAHRSGQFGGLKSGSRKEETELVGWAKVWNKTASEPTEVEVYESEYNPAYGKDQAWIDKNGWKLGLWVSKPRTMIQKVAESQALRRAFNISGVYEPAEVDNWHESRDVIDAETKVKKALSAENEIKDTKAVAVK